MYKANTFSLAVFLCAAFVFSCTEEKPVELPAGKTKEYTYDYCVFIDNRSCDSGKFSRSCRGNGVLSNSCPFANVVETYSYCVFIEEERCEEGVFEYCYGGAALSNDCPYGEDKIVVVEESSSSSEEASSSSSEEVSSSSAQSSSSEGRGLRSSSAKTDKDGLVYQDYPTLEVGAPGVIKGWASRYWDGCKPHCSWYQNIRDYQKNEYIIPDWASGAWTICRNCDKNNNEMPTWLEHPNTYEWWQGYLGTPSGCDPHNMDDWLRSSTYKKWKADNPKYPDSPAYTCWDMAPYVINDTLAYAFAATSPEESVCGKCFQLQFDGGDHFNPYSPRDTHNAIRGKTLIVMSSNIGGEVQKGQFDIMIPGGGLGAFDSFSGQINVPVDDLGATMGGLLTTCIDQSIDYYKTTMEYLRECIVEKCHKVFGNKAKELLDGCLFMENWYMAADNPTLVYKETPCPKYLIDKYKSKVDLEPPPVPYW